MSNEEKTNLTIPACTNHVDFCHNTIKDRENTDRPTKCKICRFLMNRKRLEVRQLNSVVCHARRQGRIQKYGLGGREWVGSRRLPSPRLPSPSRAIPSLPLPSPSPPFPPPRLPVPSFALTSPSRPLHSPPSFPSLPVPSLPLRSRPS